MFKLIFILFLKVIISFIKSEDSTCPFEITILSDVIDCSGYANKHGKLKLNGLQLSDKDNNPIQLQGSSSFGLQYYPDCVTKESISYLVQNWGVTVFRAVVSLADTGYTANPTFFDQYVDNIVNWCEELGIYVIIDWHLLDPGDPNFYLTSRGAHTGIAIDFWKKMATLYKSKSHVIYEIANEPNGVDWNTTLDYHNAVISEIRKIDPETIIIAGTTHWSQEIQYAYIKPVNQPYNVLYAFHFYANTHGYLIPAFQTYSSLVPVFVSEWGLSDSTCNGDLNGKVADQYLEILAGSDDTPAISWLIWSFSDKDETCSALNVGACSQRAWDSLTCAGLYMVDYMKQANLNGSFGCLHSTTTYPTSIPTSVPTYPPVPHPLTDSQLIIRFLKVNGSIAGGLLLVGAILYYLQIVYYPRRPQDKAHIPSDDVITRLSRSATQWTARALSIRNGQPINSIHLHSNRRQSNNSNKNHHIIQTAEENENEENEIETEGNETEAIVKKGQRNSSEKNEFLIDNPLKRHSNNGLATMSLSSRPTEEI